MNPHVFAALAEPNRFNIIELLREQPRSVNEVASHLRLNQPQTSKHLKFLAHAGLVEVRPIAQKRVYELRTEPLKEIDTWIQKYRLMWEQHFDKLDVLFKTEQKLHTVKGGEPK